MREACLPYILQQKFSPSYIEMTDGFPSITRRMYQNHPILPACSLVRQHLADGPCYFFGGWNTGWKMSKIFITTDPHWIFTPQLDVYSKYSDDSQNIKKYILYLAHLWSCALHILQESWWNYEELVLISDQISVLLSCLHVGKTEKV